ncbi:hypothetical protein IWX48DRAFT_615129 [Phyllosticta citricarpa]
MAAVVVIVVGSWIPPRVGLLLEVEPVRLEFGFFPSDRRGSRRAGGPSLVLVVMLATSWSLSLSFFLSPFLIPLSLSLFQFSRSSLSSSGLATAFRPGGLRAPQLFPALVHQTEGARTMFLFVKEAPTSTTSTERDGNRETNRKTEKIRMTDYQEGRSWKAPCRVVR